MKEFDYIIKDRNGIHAVPACKLAVEAKKYRSQIFVSCKGREADISDVLEMMSLNVKQGDQISIRVSGEDENSDFESIKAFVHEVL